MKEIKIPDFLENATDDEIIIDFDYAHNAYIRVENILMKVEMCKDETAWFNYDDTKEDFTYCSKYCTRKIIKWHSNTAIFGKFVCVLCDFACFFLLLFVFAEFFV